MLNQNQIAYIRFLFFEKLYNFCLSTVVFFALSLNCGLFDLNGLFHVNYRKSIDCLRKFVDFLQHSVVVMLKFEKK